MRAHACSFCTHMCLQYNLHGTICRAFMRLMTSAHNLHCWLNGRMHELLTISAIARVRRIEYIKLVVSGWLRWLKALYNCVCVGIAQDNFKRVAFDCSLRCHYHCMEKVRSHRNSNDSIDIFLNDCRVKINCLWVSDDFQSTSNRYEAILDK